MMIQLFDVQDKQVRPNHNCYLIPELAEIIETFPNNYLKVLAYIFFTTCPDGTNAYANMNEDVKESCILADIKPEFDLEDAIIIAAQEKCRELYETPSLRTYIGAKKALDRVTIYLSETEITDGKDGSSMTIDRYMTKLSDYRKAVKDAENDLKEEQAKVRGNIKLRYDQRPGYTDTKADKKPEQ